MQEPQRVNGVSALELTMRDVLDNMEELINEAAFMESCADFEILEIAPPEDDDVLKAPETGSRTRPTRPYLAYQADRHVA